MILVRKSALFLCNKKMSFKEYIKVFYQPVIRVKTGEICGYEALVRWVDPKIGMLSPGEFIETLEQFHLIHLVDQFVIRKVCEDYNKLKEKLPKIYGV